MYVYKCMAYLYTETNCVHVFSSSLDSHDTPALLETHFDSIALSIAEVKTRHWVVVDSENEYQVNYNVMLGEPRC